MENQSSVSFEQWQIEKKIKPSDLIFTQSLKSSIQKDLFNQTAELLASLKPSFSEGLKILETVTDLILMGHNESIFENSKTLDIWKLHLQQLRFPHTTSQDVDLKTKLENLPWPSQSKVKFERRGDRAGVEVKLFISSSADLTKIISAFERIQTEFSK